MDQFLSDTNGSNTEGNGVSATDYEFNRGFLGLPGLSIWGMGLSAVARSNHQGSRYYELAVDTVSMSNP